jgi:hypothetical protein
VASPDQTRTDEDILRRIDALIAEEHHLYHDRELTVADRDRLDQLSAEVDRLWDELRRLRAMRRAGGAFEQPKPSGRDFKPSKGAE